MEHRRVGGVAVRAIGAAGRDDADRRRLRRHRPDLHRRGVGAQHLGLLALARAQVEGVVHRPRRVALRHVECCEIVPLRLDLGSGRDRETQVRENLRQLVHHLGDRVDAALLARRHRQRHVERLGRQPPLQLGRFQCRLARADRLGHLLAKRVDARPLGLALLRAHPAQRLEELGDRALLAERGDPFRFQCRKVGRRGNARQQVGLCVACHAPASRGGGRPIGRPAIRGG